MCTNDNTTHAGDAARREGTIRRLISDRGFGFIRPTLTNETAGTWRKDIFFHAAQVVGVRYEELREDDTVRYTQEDDPHGKGPIATGVERLTRTPLSNEGAALTQWPLTDAATREGDNVYDWGASA